MQNKNHIKESVKDACKLAKLELNKDEIENVERSLHSILDWIAQIEEVQCDFCPIDDTPLRSLREDFVNDGGIRDEILSTAPAKRYGYIVLPKVIE